MGHYVTESGHYRTGNKDTVGLGSGHCMTWSHDITGHYMMGVRTLQNIT